MISRSSGLPSSGNYPTSFLDWTQDTAESQLGRHPEWTPVQTIELGPGTWSVHTWWADYWGDQVGRKAGGAPRTVDSRINICRPPEGSVEGMSTPQKTEPRDSKQLGFLQPRFPCQAGFVCFFLICIKH